jgi:hypothetical protein
MRGVKGGNEDLNILIRKKTQAQGWRYQLRDLGAMGA